MFPRPWLCIFGIFALTNAAIADESTEKENSRRVALPEWSSQNTIGRMEGVMGKFPRRHTLHGLEGKPPEIEFRVEEETDCGSYLRRLISYQSEPNNRVPAYLLIPKSALSPKARPAPAVLCLHPTNQELGAKVAVGLGGAANRAYAQELAQRGFVTLAPCYPTMGGYDPDLEKLGYQSGTMKAIYDNVRGLDLLETLPYVKHGSYGAIGHSLGGHNAIFTAVFEPRLSVVVSSCGFDSFQDYYSGDSKMWEPGKGWTQQRYMPRLSDYAGRLNEIPFDFDELIATLAPRVVFVSAPLSDTNFQWRSVDRMIDAAKPLFRAHNLENNLEVTHPDCGHDFPDAIRERAYQLFDKHLR
jgi:dienelactone hydrolase